MGGSRRRNVPDRLEQPMMRNEHIVRAHHIPEYLTNTQNNGTPWNVIHVITRSAGGDGTAEAPFTNLADADTAATRPWDIVTFTKETAVLLRISMMIHFSSIKTISFFAAADHSPSLLPELRNV